MINETDSLSWILDFLTIGLLIVSALLVMLKFLISSSNFDRVLVVDVLTTWGIALCLVLATTSGISSWLDLAILFSALSAAATIGLCYYLENIITDRPENTNL